MRSGTKLRNFSLLFRPPKLGSGTFRLKLMHRAVSRRTIISQYEFLESNKTCKVFFTGILVNLKGTRKKEPHTQAVCIRGRMFNHQRIGKKLQA